MADTPLVRGVFSERCAAAALRDMAKRLQAAVVVVVDRKEGRERGREGTVAVGRRGRGGMSIYAGAGGP